MRIGLKPGTVTERIDNQRRSGTVLSQKPSPYSKVSKGTAVDIVISKRNMISLPNVYGMEEQKAADKLKQLGFRVTVKTALTDLHKPGTVIKMYPSNGSFAKGSPVFLTVAQAKPKPAAVSISGTEKPGIPAAN